MEQIQVREWHDFNSCDELIEFMVNNKDLELPLEASFQGDVIQFIDFPINDDGNAVMDTKHNAKFHVLGAANGLGGSQALLVGLDKLTVALPYYIKDELITTLKGEY